MKYDIEKIKDKIRKQYQDPKTGKLHGQNSNVYKSDSLHLVGRTKRFGGSYIHGEHTPSKHVLNLSKKKALSKAKQ